MATGFSAYLNADYMWEQFQEIAIKIGDWKNDKTQ